MTKIMTPKIVPFGSDIKIQVIINDLPDELTMQDIDFSCRFYVGTAEVTLAKTDLKNPDDEVYLAPIETSSLSRGDLWLEVTASIPDTDFSDGFRHEIQIISTGIKIV